MMWSPAPLSGNEGESVSSRMWRAPLAVLLAGFAVLGFFRIGTDDNSSTSASTSGVRPGDIPCGSGPLAGAGSTFAKNIELQWIQDYTHACPGSQLNYNATGSGAGIQSFSDNQVDWAGSDSVMKPDEQVAADKRCGNGNHALHLPVSAGGLVFTYNLPGLDSTTLRLSPQVISGLFQGEITSWDDPKVVADNPGVVLPKLTVQPVHRSDSSGTTDVFSRYLAATAGKEWKLGTGKELQWAGGQAAKGSDGVTVALKSAPGGITYTEESFAKANQLTMAQLRNGAGEYVTANGATVSKALEAAQIDASRGDLRVSVDFRTAVPGVYSASAVTYAIVCDKGNADGEGVKDYLTYATGRGQQSAEPLGYAPLPGPISARLEPLIAGIA
jgi:phosphate transport system substrate-binding protein